MKKHLILAFVAILALNACDEQPADQEQIGAGTPAYEQAAPAAGDASALPEVIVDEEAQSGTLPPERPETLTEDVAEGDAAVSSPVNPEAIPDADIPPPPNREVFKDATCDFEAWVGKPLDEEAVKAEGRPYRILTPGAPMTMDHSPDRINVEHDATNVTRVWCG